MKKIIRVTCLICVMVMASVAFTSCLPTTLGIGNELSGNVKKSKVQKDKSAIAELRQAICVTVSDEKYIEAEANENGANVAEDGTLDIEDLFDSEKNYDIAEAVSAAFGADEIRLDSDIKKNCMIKLYMDGKNGKVVLQVLSPEYTYYLDENGEHEGEY